MDSVCNVTKNVDQPGKKILMLNILLKNKQTKKKFVQTSLVGNMSTFQTTVHVEVN